MKNNTIERKISTHIYEIETKFCVMPWVTVCLQMYDLLTKYISVTCCYLLKSVKVLIGINWNFVLGIDLDHIHPFYQEIISLGVIA